MRMMKQLTITISTISVSRFEAAVGQYTKYYTPKAKYKT